MAHCFRDIEIAAFLRSVCEWTWKAMFYNGHNAHDCCEVAVVILALRKNFVKKQRIGQCPRVGKEISES